MIYRHQYLNESFLSNKSIEKVNQEKPLVVLISKKFTFMNDFVILSLKLNKVKFEIRQTDQKQIMNYQLPAIAFQNYFLSQETLIQFIADLMLQKQSFVDMSERKNLVKDQYMKWIRIIKEQHTGLCRYSNLANVGINTEQDYFNHLFSHLFSMASWIKGDILQRKYETFKKNEVNFQTLFIYDIVKSILQLCGKTKVDHILRAHFQNLIEFQQDLKIKIETVNRQRQNNDYNEIQVVTDKIIQNPVVQHPKFKLNWKRFTIAFSIAAAIYIKWVQ